MAEEFQARICGENWWSIDSTRSVFPLSSSSSSPCSVDAGNYRQIDIMDSKETKKSCAEETNNTNNNLVSDSYLGFFEAQKPHKSESSSASGSGSILIDSTLQMMGFGLNSSTSPSWNQPLLPERNFQSMLQEETVIDSSNSQIQRDHWNRPKSFSSDGRSINQVSTFKPTIMNQEFSLDQQQSLSSVTSTLLSSSSDCGNFPIGSASYGCPSMSMQRLYEDPGEDNLQPQPQQLSSLFTNRSMSYSSKANYGTSSNELSPIWSSKVSTFLKPSPIGKQQPIGLHFSNNTPFWNASAEALHDMRAGHAFAESTFHEGKPNCPSTLLNKLKSEESLNSVSIGKKINVCETAFKRPRIETPSTFPTFKVRKEKLGDRVTALQQLVSPFGKTDTASVLHEAIEYIKFLHDQVSVLSTPYMKNGAPIQQKQGCEDTEGSKQDLKSRGLCLVPISSTFPVATETTSDLWTPTLGGSLLR